MRAAKRSETSSSVTDANPSAVTVANGAELDLNLAGNNTITATGTTSAPSTISNLVLDNEANNHVGRDHSESDQDN